MRVRDLFRDWPPQKWAAGDPKCGALTSDPRELRLLWFSAPDEDGWFSLTATDAEGTSWSTYCRTTENLWHSLEHALGEHLKRPLGLVGDVELEAARPRPK